MAAPYFTSWNPAAKVAVHTALRDLLDAATNPAYMTAHDAGDVLLATATLGDPCGTVDPVTGALNLSIAVQEDSAPAGGDIAYWTLYDGAGTPYRSIPAEEGTAPAPGKVVMNTLTVLPGGPAQVLSASVV
ncbi:hypothetical protein dqs_0633 [Azoarcus olearius]|uniref:hypothetical protein n=1 Tax=Azoarcus sp. (strain BH72) TaxID=418699 RepID=UPI0008063383|nr:hypothetical protein [Azoarcus olearius]ANQ83709.1 hypothetical protein dqs_0633 [Azoarcus olearius]